jgi:3-dehydroquinate synthase
MTRETPPAIEARIGDRGYPVHLDSGILASLGERWVAGATGEAVLLVHDANVTAIAMRAEESLAAAGIRVVSAPVPPGESSKSLAELERLARLAAAAGLRRRDGVVAVGGGVIGDLAGFLAASYQRGVPLAHVPTTLLAMVDSAIGGKTGVDIPEGKNYVGAIWQPELVLIDTDVLDTLPARELASGFAEVVKYGLLDGPELFELVESWPALPGPRDRLRELILRCVTHKIDVVADDEHDHGRRASLNLGHTVAHGIEAALGYAGVTHGEAVAVGLMPMLRLSEELCGLDPSWRIRTGEVLARHGLPTRLEGVVAVDDVLAAAARDKKSDGRSLNMVLIDAPGSIRLGVDPPPRMLRDAVAEVLA